MERFSISISSEMKRQLEQKAKANFRSLSGEINKALYEYLVQNGVNVVQSEQAKEPKEVISTQTTSPVVLKESISTTIHTYDEVEEF